MDEKLTPTKLWYHSINDNSWDKKSYKNIYSINNFYDYNIVRDLFKQNHYQNGMFFIMKEDIFPNWEDPLNRMGGCLSFKVPSVNIVNYWNDLVLNFLTDKILKTSNENINGISISPKKEFNIIKIWFNDDSYDYKKDFIEYGEHHTISNSIYKKHTFN